MEAVDQGKFSCDGCGKSYKWKPELAGRRVKCKCGFVMTAPKDPPAAADADGPDLDALYSLADEGKQAARSAVAEVATIRCPSCQTEMAPGSSLCASCGFNLKTGTKAKPRAAASGGAFVPGGGGGGGGGGAAVAPAGGAFAAFGAPRKRGDLVKEDRNDAIVDWYIPIALLIVGIGLGVLRWMIFSADQTPFPQALMYTGLKLVLGFALLAVSAIFMIQWGEIAFGDPLNASLKIAAAVTAPVAIAEIISFLIHDAPPTGWGMVGYFLAFGMFFTFYHYMFEWDMSEKWVVVGVSTIVCMLVVPFAFRAIQGQGGVMANTGAKNNNALYDYQVELGRAKPAREWINEHNGRMVGDLPRETSTQLIEDLYGLKPKNGELYILVSEGPQAGEIMVLLPSDSKKRKAFFDFRDEFNGKKGGKPVADDGGKWMIMRFLPVPLPEPAGFL